MLRIVTGEPGASKTLNVIKSVCEDDNFKGRQVYYHGIKELSDSLGWIEIDAAGCHDWDNLPEGSILIVDEVQYVWPKRGQSSKCPDSVMQMSTHRHDGKDIILISQHPTLIDHDARKFANEHWHFERPFNTNRPRRFTFQKCAHDPDDYHKRQEALVDTITIDKKYFGLYKSTAQNTHKSKLPKKVYFIGLMILAVLGGSSHFAYRLTDRYSSDNLPDAAVRSQIENNQFLDSALSINSKPVLSYQDQWLPRVAGLPHTAPVYDDLNKPKVRPLPNCIKSRSKGCKCYTQQATRMDVPESVCLDIVRHGFFDPARDIDSEREQGRKGRASVAADTRLARQPLKPIGMRVVLNNNPLFASK